MTDWQPIETAPKDGKRLLLARAGSEEDGEGFATMGWWMDAEPDGSDFMGHDAGWVDVDYGDFFPGRSFGNPQYFREARTPTHWMPMPAPPVN